ncbi:MAG: hypothetical protein ACRDCY_03220 [Aeromonas veronii]
MEKMLQHPIVAGVIVLGFGVLISTLRQWWRFQADEKKIVDFIRRSSYRFRSSEAISSATNLTRERVEKVAMDSDRITRNGKEKETWRLTE